MKYVIYSPTESFFKKSTIHQLENEISKIFR